MPSAETATHQPQVAAPPARMGLHDAFWTQVLLFWMRWLPAPVFTILTYPVAASFIFWPCLSARRCGRISALSCQAKDQAASQASGCFSSSR
jgi:hypothetical protein